MVEAQTQAPGWVQDPSAPDSGRSGPGQGHGRTMAFRCSRTPGEGSLSSVTQPSCHRPGPRSPKGPRRMRFVVTWVLSQAHLSTDAQGGDHSSPTHGLGSHQACPEESRASALLENISPWGLSKLSLPSTCSCGCQLALVISSCFPWAANSLSHFPESSRILFSSATHSLSQNIS